MSYEKEAKELMKKFKLQYESQNAMKPNQDQETKNHLENLKEDVKNIGVTQNDNIDISEIINRGHFPGDNKTIQPTIDPNTIGNNMGMPDNIITPDSGGGTEQGLLKDIEIPKSNTKVLNVPHQPAPISQPTGVPMPAGGGVCPQCNTIHPPVKMGEKCPNAVDDLKEKGMDEVSINKFIVDLKNIITSQMDKKDIQDAKKFFQHATIELMKILEEYNE
jgi:hypothetical protein